MRIGVFVVAYNAFTTLGPVLERIPRSFRSSIDVTFASLARVYGARAAGVLLTGMGVDGAAGLLAIRQAGGRTIVQNQASCVVFGKPAAIGPFAHSVQETGRGRGCDAGDRFPGDCSAIAPRP